MRHRADSAALKLNSRSIDDSNRDGAPFVRFGTHALEGIQYSYHVTYAPVPAGVAWRAIVRDDSGALRATPRGLVRGLRVEASDFDARLHAAVTGSIDAR